MKFLEKGEKGILYRNRDANRFFWMKEQSSKKPKTKKKNDVWRTSLQANGMQIGLAVDKMQLETNQICCVFIQSKGLS